MSILEASKNPFYAQLRSIVSTALQKSIQFTNQIKGRVASVDDHAAVLHAIAARGPSAARIAMAGIIGEVLALVASGSAGTQEPAN